MMRGLGTRTRGAWILSALFAVLALGACGTDTDSAIFEESVGGAPVESAPLEDTREIEVDEQIIRTASASIDVTDIDSAVDSIVSSVRQVDGSIQAQSVYRYDDQSNATITARVPADRLDSFLDDLYVVGDVTSSDVAAQDVTLEVVDLDARITTLEESINRLRVLQQQAESVADLVAVESELATRQSELESISARRDYLANQVAMSTVYLTLAEKRSGAAIAPDFLGGLERGWDALLTLGAGLITGAGFLTPIAVLVTVVLLVIFAILRYRRRTRRSDEG